MSRFRIIYDEYGQTGNRLFSYLDSIGWAIAENRRLIILFPDKILRHFDRLRNSRYVSLPLYGGGKLVWKVARKLFYYNRLIQAFYRTEISRKLGFFAGWDLREAKDYYPKVLPQIQALFIPNDDVKKPVDALFRKVHESGKIIVGIHIRRGDYKTAYSGKYWYEDDVYMGYMRQMQSLCPDCVFYVASNEKVSEELVAKYPTLDSPVCNAAGDLYALSQCDYILGPPSTFNCWASFIGRVPLYTMFEPNKTITLSSFAVMREAWDKT